MMYQYKVEPEYIQSMKSKYSLIKKRVQQRRGINTDRTERQTDGRTNTQTDRQRDGEKKKTRAKQILN